MGSKTATPTSQDDPLEIRNVSPTPYSYSAHKVTLHPCPVDVFVCVEEGCVGQSEFIPREGSSEGDKQVKTSPQGC